MQAKLPPIYRFSVLLHQNAPGTSTLPPSPHDNRNNDIDTLAWGILEDSCCVHSCQLTWLGEWVTAHCCTHPSCLMGTLKMSVKGKMMKR